MAPCTSPLTPRKGNFFGFSAGLVLLAYLMCAAVQAQTLPQKLQDLGLSFFPGADRIADIDGPPPAAAVFRGRELLGYVFLSDDVVRIPAYSGKPVSVLVGFDVSGTIRGVRIVAHQEPILLVGITEQNLSDYVNQYIGGSVFDRFKIGGEPRPGYVTVDGISGATITIMVLNANRAPDTSPWTASAAPPSPSWCSTHPLPAPRARWPNPGGYPWPGSPRPAASPIARPHLQ